MVFMLVAFFLIERCRESLSSQGNPSNSASIWKKGVAMVRGAGPKIYLSKTLIVHASPHQILQELKLSFFLAGQYNSCFIPIKRCLGGSHLSKTVKAALLWMLKKPS